MTNTLQTIVLFYALKLSNTRAIQKVDFDFLVLKKIQRIGKKLCYTHLKATLKYYFSR